MDAGGGMSKLILPSRRSLILGAGATFISSRVRALTNDRLTLFSGGKRGDYLIGQTIAGPSSAGGATMNRMGVAGTTTQWDWGDGAITNGVSDGASPSHAYSANGPHTYKIKLNSGAAAVTSLIISGANGGYSQLTGGNSSTHGASLGLPSGINKLANLTFFQSDDTWLTGSVPSFSFAPKLAHFDVQGNYFSGNCPDFSSNPALTYCDIHFAGFSGQLPSFAACPLLAYFEAHVNSFSGSLPSFNNCTALTHFGMQNAWGGAVGTLPSFAACTALTTFTVDAVGDGTGINGAVPSFATCTALTSFSTYGSFITGVTAGSFATQKNLTNLNLSYGSLPSAEVNKVLADCVTSLSISGRAACTVQLGLYNNQAPTGQGLTDKATLIAAGWTVNTT